MHEALEALERARSLNPNNADVIQLGAYVRLQPAIAEPRRALEDARLALRLSPADPFAWARRTLAGEALLQLGEYEAALAELEPARTAPNADWKPCIVAMVAALAAGRNSLAEDMLAEARGRRSDLTLAIVRRAQPWLFTLPALVPHAARLVELGLPQE